MFIYIGNLPGEATLIELQEFLGDHAMSVDFSAHRHPQQSDHHFVLIKAMGDAEADQLVSDLNGKPFKGVRVQARRWVERAEKRAWQGPERRFQQLDLDLIFNPVQ